MSFFIKSAAAALKAYPNVHAFIEGDDIVAFPNFDIGVAVSTEKGLMVPVVRGCDAASFGDVEKQVEQMAKKAREGLISMDDLRGGCFTITNGGVFGSLLSTPILNPPQSAILGMHAIVKRPIVVNDQIVIRPMMYLALSYDHRIVDGKESVQFLVHMKENLEDPSRLLLEL
jgi:2-oxoglutarate dehydrogenase E2 component (dihydrolipoamide succinyltransferase)